MVYSCWKLVYVYRICCVVDKISAALCQVVEVYAFWKVVDTISCNTKTQANVVNTDVLHIICDLICVGGLCSILS